MFYNYKICSYSKHNFNLSYWIGSQVTGQPIYQYRLILPYDEGGLVNVSSNADMSSVDGEIKHPINPNLSLKSNFSVSCYPLPHT